jgi:nicotinamidase-related amidase
MPLVDRADSLLVVVDTQPGFFAYDAMSEETRAESTATVERIRWLAGMATSLGIPAVVTEEGPEREGATDAVVLERLAAGTPVLVKPTFSLAASAEVAGAIEATQRRTAVMAGYETDVCVAQSAIELHDRGFRVVVVADAVFSGDRHHHEHGLARIAQAGVEINHCKGLIFEWLRTVDEAMEKWSAATKAFGRAPFL